MTWLQAWRARRCAAAATIATDQSAALAPEILEGIQANAQLVITELGKAREAPLGFDATSVAWVEGYIERLRTRDLAAARALVATLGSYLGEANVAGSSGRWARDKDGRVGLHFTAGDWCYPFAKVEKQVENGVEGGESIASFYNVAINVVAAGKLSQATTSGDR